MEYNETPPSNDFDGIITNVNHGYSISQDRRGYMIRIIDTNLPEGMTRHYTIKMRTKNDGEIMGLSVEQLK